MEAPRWLQHFGHKAACCHRSGMDTAVSWAAFWWEKMGEHWERKIRRNCDEGAKLGNKEVVKRVTVTD